MFGRKVTRDGAWDRWQPLPPNDPFVQQYCEPGEVVYNGVTAIDWKLRSRGVARELTERLLIVTSKRLLLVDNDGDLLAMPWSMVTGIEDRTMGLQGLITVRVGDNWAEWSMHHQVAPVVAKKMREFWAAADQSPSWVDRETLLQDIHDIEAGRLESDDEAMTG